MFTSIRYDFPRLWKDPRTPDRERKRMARLLLEDVTLCKGDNLLVHVRVRGGATETLTLPRPLSAAQGRRTAPELVAESDRRLDEHTDGEVAAVLNAAGHRSYDGKPFQGRLVAGLRTRYGLAHHRRRLQARGLLTERQLATALGVAPETLEQRNLTAPGWLSCSCQLNCRAYWATKAASGVAVQPARWTRRVPSAMK